MVPRCYSTRYQHQHLSATRSERAGPVPQQEMLGIYVPHAGASGQYNADGYLRFADTGEKTKAYGYTQLFRSGITEYADASIFYLPMANVGSMGP